MSKPVFDIIPTDPAAVEWPLCRLIINISRRHFHYMVLNEKNQVAVLKLYRFEENDVAELAGLVEEIVKEDMVLQQQMHDCVIVYNWPDSILVPEACFDVNLNKDMLELTHGDVHKGIVFSENIHGWNMYNVYRLPVEIHECLQRCFPNCTYWHHYSLWLTSGQHTGRHTGVSILFYPEEIIVSVMAGGQLQLMQIIGYQTADDVAWHVLNIFQRFHLLPHETPLYICGMIDTHAPAYQLLVNYFGAIASGNTPPVFAESAVCPASFFTPILNYSLCV